MDPITAKFQADVMRRHRFCPFLFKLTPDFKSWSASMQYDYWERIGMIDGDSPIITAEAHIYALNQVLQTDEP